MMATPDVPLIAAFAFLLFSLAKLQQTGKGAWWLAAGLALGLGLMSKYTMAFFGLGVVVWLALAPGMRKWFATPWPWVAAALALAIFSPMLIWNAGHD